MKKLTLTFCSITFALGVVALGCQTASTTVADNKPAQNAPANKPVTAAASPANTAGPAATPHDDAPRITLADAKAAFDKDEAVFVDVRAAAAYNDEHIKGALNIPKDQLAAKADSLPKNKKIIAYCS